MLAFMVDPELTLSRRPVALDPETSHLVAQELHRLWMKDGSIVPVIDLSLYSSAVREITQRKIEAHYKSCAGDSFTDKSHAKRFKLSAEERYFLHQGMVFVENHKFSQSRCDLSELIHGLNVDYGALDLSGKEPCCVYQQDASDSSLVRNYQVTLAGCEGTIVSFNVYSRFMLPNQYYHGKLRMHVEKRCA